MHAAPAPGRSYAAAASGPSAPTRNPHQQHEAPQDARQQQQRPRGSNMDDAEQLRRRLNRTKVVIFPRNTEPTEAQVRLIVEVAAHLPSHSITWARRVSLKQGGCLWVVHLSDWESTRKTLQAYYSVQQLSMDFFQDPKGWGLDQA